MPKFIQECTDCKQHLLPDEVEYLCPDCSAKQEPMQPLLGILKCVYDYKALSKERAGIFAKQETGFARYLSLLPISTTEFLPRLLGFATPLRPAHALGLELGLRDLHLKDDTVLPTASFKDRASAVVVACARERGYHTVAAASTGNAATALAGQCAAVGLESVILVPADAPQAKLVQMAIYGSRVIRIRASYDTAFELAVEACEHCEWYSRNTAYNPYTIEGKKTAAYEIWEQLGSNVPDWVVIPTGDGVIAAGIEKGFEDLKELQLIDRMPKLAIVQAAGCQPIVRSFASGLGEIMPEPNPQTIADSISVGVPRAGRWVLGALERTQGTAVAVEDGEILEAMKLLGRTSGIFAEPAAAAAIAGIKKLSESGRIAPEDRVVALITGNGLKDVPAAVKAISLPEPIEATIEALKQSVHQEQ